MKKIILFAACAAMLASCSDDKVNEAPYAPATPGTEVDFSLNLDASGSSRTIYGEETKINGADGFPIYWVNGDNVLLASPQCDVKQATYAVAVDGTQQNYATSMDKVGAAGLQWGTAETTNFYSVYPTQYKTNVNDAPVVNTLTATADAAVADLHVRDYQINLFEKNASGTWVGTPIDRTSMTNLDANHKNPDAIMYAQKAHRSGSTDGNVVKLNYKPFTVAFHVTLDGYTIAQSLGEDPGLTIQEVTIEAPEGTHLVGKFQATFNSDCNTAPTVNTTVNTEATPNVIHIPTLSSIDGHYLDLKVGEKVEFNVFAIPTAGTVTSDWKLTVRTTSGTYTRSLTPGTGTNAGQLIAGQMHKLNMPSFQVSNGFQFNPASWMAQIPRNVYLSELSIPGAWYAGVTEYQSTADIATLWQAGVRAFAIETRTGSTLDAGWTNFYIPSGILISGTGNDNGANGAYKSGTSISNVIQSITGKIAADEYAVLVLSYADGGNGGHRSADYDYWLQGIYDLYNSLSSTVKGKIYTEQITPNTTIGDVKGKLIIKINVDNRITNGGSGTISSVSGLYKKNYSYSYGNNLPGLLSYTDLTWESSSLNSSLISQMYWVNWSNDYRTNISSSIGALNPSTLYWNYSVANRTQLNTGTDKKIPKYENRQASISTLLANSRTIYLAGSHNVWFYVGAGGTQATSQTSTNNSTTAFATEMNSWINTQLENKINGKDFSPFGIVMCNYITDATYTGPTIINNIIKMNRLFRLNRDENQPEWPTTTQADYAASVDTADGWTEGHIK